MRCDHIAAQHDPSRMPETDRAGPALCLDILGIIREYEHAAFVIRLGRA
jgi:hypothetical protein